ncbi:MAG: DUF2837 family protein [Verrucomicrobiae bacterium]|nr:DUF2837 family protein [Verrucomicrobiae bacterium]
MWLSRLAGTWLAQVVLVPGAIVIAFVENVTIYQSSPQLRNCLRPSINCATGRGWTGR